VGCRAGNDGSSGGAGKRDPSLRHGGAFFFWLIAEDREESSRSRVLSLVSSAILALLFAGEDRDYHWWISGFVLVGLVAERIALASALLGPLIPGPPP